MGSWLHLAGSPGSFELLRQEGRHGQDAGAVWLADSIEDWGVQLHGCL
jgi:hypothetical protein